MSTNLGIAKSSNALWLQSLPILILLFWYKRKSSTHGIHSLIKQSSGRAPTPPSHSAQSDLVNWHKKTNRFYSHSATRTEKWSSIPIVFLEKLNLEGYLPKVNLEQKLFTPHGKALHQRLWVSPATTKASRIFLIISLTAKSHATVKEARVENEELGTKAKVEEKAVTKAAKEEASQR